jgi:predicted PurR-regulated permease PerM
MSLYGIGYPWRAMRPREGTISAGRKLAIGPPIRRPTPIRISRAALNLIGLALVALLALIMWAAPILPIALLGGFALALVLSPPMHVFARFLPRGLSILLAFLTLLAVLLLATYALVPPLVSQVGALAALLPELAQNLEQHIAQALDALRVGDILPTDAEGIAARLAGDLRTSLGDLTTNMLGRTLGLIYGTLNFVLTLVAVVFVAVSLLANTRLLKAAYLTSVPKRYRRDARELWDALSRTLSHYLGGLAFVLAVQGALSAAALTLIGVPFPIALGAWVSVTAVMPFAGAFIGAIPALLVALSVSPLKAALTGFAFLLIQQFEGNFLTPHVQSRTVRVPAPIVFLGVVAGGALAGVMGVLLAVPALAVGRVAFDFFRVRLHTK